MSRVVMGKSSKASPLVLASHHEAGLYATVVHVHLPEPVVMLTRAAL